jgi:hypothetical protein
MLKNKARLDSAMDEDLMEFEDVIIEISRYSVPDPTQAMTERLLERVRSAVPSAPVPTANPWGVGRWIRLALQQASVFEKPFWVASMIIILLGLLFSLGDSQTVLFSMLAPAMAALGVAYSFRGGTIKEIELTCPVTPYQIVLGRMLVIFVFNTVLGLVGSMVLANYGSGIVFSDLVIEWLAPMLLLTGLALVTAVWFNSLVSAASSMSLWALLLSFKFKVFGVWIDWWIESLTSPQVMAVLGLGLILLGFHSAQQVWGKRGLAV